MAEIASAFVSLIPSAKGFGSKIDSEIGPDLDKAGKSGGTRFGQAMKTALVLGLAGIGVATAGFLKGAISDASDLSEATSKVGVVFGDSANKIITASKTSATSMGLTKSAYLDATGSLGNLLVSLDLAPKKAAGMSQQMVKLAGDLASFNNVPIEDALAAIQSGLTGETEPLKRFGVNMNDATLKAQALKMGLIKTTKDALTPQQKALAAQALIMAQTGTAQGDFARTSGGLANQQRILSAQFGDLKATIGAKLLPVMTTLVTFVNGRLLPGLTGVGDAIKSVGGFVSSNQTTFKALAVTLGVILLPTVIAMTAAFIASAASTVATTAAFTIYALAVNAISIATKLAAAGQWLLNAAMSANPIGLIIIGLIALGAGLVLLWKKSETFRSIVTGAFNAVKAAAGFVFNFIKSHWPLLLAILTGPIGLAVLFIVRNWDKIKSTTSSLISSVIGFFRNLGSGVRDKVGDLIGFVKTIPGKIKSGLGNLGDMLLKAGEKIISGLITGITNKIKDVGAAMGKVAGKIKGFLPGSPIIEGPLKQHGWNTGRPGKLLVRSLVGGIVSESSTLTSTMSGLTSGLNASVSVPSGVTWSGDGASSLPSGPLVKQYVYPQPGQSEEEIGRAAANRILWVVDV